MPGCYTVEPRAGFEPAPSDLEDRCSSNRATGAGRREGIRTPTKRATTSRATGYTTSAWFRGQESNLQFPGPEPGVVPIRPPRMVSMEGFEPPKAVRPSALQAGTARRRCRIDWSGRRESNPRSRAPEARVLPSYTTPSGTSGGSRTPTLLHEHPGLSRACLPVPPRRLVPAEGFEPSVSALRGRCPWPLDDAGWSERRGSNPRPPRWQRGALPTVLHSLVRPAGFEPAIFWMSTRRLHP